MCAIIYIDESEMEKTPTLVP